jgi:hypothetical protein
MIKHINVYRAMICTRQTLCSEKLGLHIKNNQMLFMIFVKQEQLTMPWKFLNATAHIKDNCHVVKIYVVVQNLDFATW